MINLFYRIQSPKLGLMLLCLLGSPFVTMSQIDFQITREINSLFPDEGSMETIDIDQDGDLDILSMGRSSINGVNVYSTKLLLNDGAANFSPMENTPFIGSHFGDADFGDVDSDGDLDILIVGEKQTGGTPTGSLYINQGSAGFTVADPNPIPAVKDSEVEFFDFNGDPHLDILVAGTTGTLGLGRFTKIFTGDGQGNFEEVLETGLDQMTRANAAFGDINGDGVDELFLSGLYIGSTVHFGAWIYYKENGKYIRGKKLSYVHGSDAKLADFDQDGDLDYLLTGYNDVVHTVEYFLNNGTGEFTKVSDHPFRSGARFPRVVVEDFDLDEDLDVFISGPNGDILQNYLYLNDGNGSFIINEYPFPVTRLVGSGVGNFDGKGYYDFIFFGIERQKAKMYLNNTELNEPPVISDLTVTGEPLVNFELIATYGYQDKEEGADQSTFQWYRADDVTGENKTIIEGATLISYSPATLDEGKYVSLEVTPFDGILKGAIVQSDWIGPVKIPVPQIAVLGNSRPIVNGSVLPSIEDHTNFEGIHKSGTITKEFILGNNGKADLIIEDILIEGESSEDFSLITPEALPIVPGATLNFTINFSPLGLGIRTAVVSITSNDLQNSPYRFAISAEGYNSSPVFGSPTMVEIQENSEGEILNINATDGEGGLEDENVIYQITGGEDKDSFWIDPESGRLSFIFAPNFEAPLDSNKDNIYLVEVTVDDGEAENNIATQSISVTVVNFDELPIAVCKEGISIFLGADGKSGISPGELDGGSRDDSGITALTVEPNIFTCENVGPVTVTLTVKDTGGQIASCTTTITVIDNQVPVISSVGPIAASSESGKCSASITITPPLVLDNCASWEAIGARSDSRNLADPFPIGETFITWKTDTQGLGEDVVQTITVKDSEEPLIAAVDPIFKDNDLGSHGAFIEIPAPKVFDCGEVSLTGTRMDGFKLNEIYPIGETVIIWTATDGTNNALAVEQKIYVRDVEKPVIEAPQEIIVISSGGNCGSFVTVTPPLVLDNFKVSTPPVATRGDDESLSLQDIFPVGKTIIKWTAADDNSNLADVVYQTINVSEREPIEIIITGPEGPQIIGTAIDMTAEFTDENIVEANWMILDGGVILQESSDTHFSPETKESSHTFQNLPAGVFTVSLDLKYSCGKVVSKNYEYVVIYDPNGGFVTGGGWIFSPPGAMRDLVKNTIEGKANFGFNAKYKSGKNEMDLVDGETNFQFKAGDLYFKSSSHEAMSLVVSGGFKATYKGTGSINGEGGYNFMVTVIDADKTVNHLIDLFRIKIWKSGTVIYDNNLGNNAEDADPATAIGGGSIVIHKPKGNNKTSIPELVQLEENEIRDELEVFSAYPNPMENSAIIEFSIRSSTTAVLSLYDMNGREVQRLFDAKVEQGKVYKVELLKKNIMGGNYLYRLTTGLGETYQKQLLVK